jgi:hypothetical protein
VQKPLSDDPSELQIVTLFRSRAKMLCPGVMIVAVPNGGKRSQWAAQQAKREGLATGFPDCLCFWRGGGVAMIEFKARKGKLSLAQEEWLDRLVEFGFPASVARSADEALDFLRECGAPFVGKVMA